MQTVTIVGAGRAGGALAIALRRAGWKIDSIVFREHKPESLLGAFDRECFKPWTALDEIDTQLLLIATADPDIKATATRIADFTKLPTTALHLSGSLDSRELAALAEKGVSVGSMHPLVSISDPVLGANRIEGSFFCLEGSEAAVELARSMVNSLGAESFSIATGSKPLYHASAVMASGHLTALIDTAVETLAKCGLSASEAKQVLFPLITSTVANIQLQNSAEALTGTFARGDAAAFQRHLESIERMGSANVREIYLTLGQRSIELLRRDRAENGRLDELEQAISMAKENCG